MARKPEPKRKAAGPSPCAEPKAVAPGSAFDCAGLRHIKKRAFLKALAQTANISLAAKAAKINRCTPVRWRADKNDALFQELYDQAIESACDLLEAEAQRRAVFGVEEPVYQGGELVGTIQRYSDTLLIFLLKGARPAKYRERYEINTTGLTDEELDGKIAEYIRKVGVAAFAGGEGKKADQPGQISASA